MNTQVSQANAKHRIVIVGGGAGGLSLATAIGDKLGKSKQAHITLIDKDRSHIWKPKLHEVAAGSMDFTLHEIDYLAHSHWHHFTYRIGAMTSVDRQNKLVHVSANIDNEGNEVTPERSFAYDTLVVAIGSRTNDFGIPGVEKHAIQLDTTDQAKRFHQRLVNACIRANAKQKPLNQGQLNIAIVGAGATGVELSAELHGTVRELIKYGLENLSADNDVVIHIIEAEKRVLPALSEHISVGAQKILNKLDVKVHTSAFVKEVTKDGVHLASGDFINAELVVWAAGVRAQVCLTQMDGLENNRINQLIVKPTLQTTLDENIFAFGDCASCPLVGGEEGQLVPPRAQAANQQAQHLAKQLPKHIKGEAVDDYHYKDYGSLIALGERWATGGLMGSLSHKTLFIEGYVARFMYNMLYKSHQMSTKGFWKTGLEWLAGKIRKNTGPKVKLH